MSDINKCKARIPNFCKPNFGKCKDCGYMLAYNNGKEDERTKVFNEIMGYINTSNRGTCDYFIVDQIERYITE